MSQERSTLKAELVGAEDRIRHEAGRAQAMRDLLHATHRAVVARWPEQNRLIDDNGALKEQVAGLEAELSSLRDSQEQVFAKLRQRTDMPIAKEIGRAHV